MNHVSPRTIPDGARPRVLLVDDHRGILDRASAMLEAFDVVGTATDGTQAIEMASHVSPDVVVLDINMPGLDGFQTKRALEASGSRAPVVFLSAAEADEYVGEAFRCGGRAYVLKPYLARDLPRALDQVLQGRVFVPSLTSLFELTNGRGGHAMQLHRGLDCFLDGLASFFDVALRRGDATCVIATEEVRAGLQRRLRGVGWDVGDSAECKRYLAIDASAALNRFMRHGLPDPDVVAEIASELEQYRRTVGEGTGPLSIFGNMVVPLITSGNARAAIALESQWNQLTHDLPFLTLCGYSAACFHDCPPDVWSRASHEHWALSHASDV